MKNKNKIIDIEKEKNIIARLFIFCIKVLIKGLYEIKSYDRFFDQRDYALP